MRLHGCGTGSSWVVMRLMRAPVGPRRETTQTRPPRRWPAWLHRDLHLAGGGPQPGSTSNPSPTVNSATATPTATSSPSATAPASAAWANYTTADGQLTFEHPAAWSVRDPAGELPEGGGAFAEVTNQAGKPLATLRTNMATGSTCLERFPYEVMESEELPLLAQGGPAPTSDSACAIFHLFTWPPTAAMFGAFYNPANNVTPGAESLPYLEQAKKYAETPEYRDIKRMITSLRPAG